MSITVLKALADIAEMGARKFPAAPIDYKFELINLR